MIFKFEVFPAGTFFTYFGIYTLVVNQDYRFYSIFKNGELEFAHSSETTALPSDFEAEILQNLKIIHDT